MAQIHGVIHQISTRFPGRPVDSLSEHEAIAAALLAGDGPGAVERIATHLRNGLDSLFHRHPLSVSSRGDSRGRSRHHTL